MILTSANRRRIVLTIVTSFAISFTSLALLQGQSELPAAFVTNNVGDSVTSFTVGPGGELQFVAITASGEGPQTISLTPDGRYLAVAHGTISETVEELRIFEVNPDATLVEVAMELVPNSPLNARWINDEVLAVTETSLSGANNLITYHFDRDQVSLEVVDTQFVGDFSYSIALARNNSLAFVNNTFGDRSIRSIEVDPTGVMKLIENQITSPLFAVAIQTSPDGNHLYGAGGISGSGNEILAFEIEENGSLSPLTGTQSPGQSPKVIGLTADGNILVAGHGTDSTIQSFLRDPVTGALTPSGFSYDVGSQGNLGDLVVLGNRMFVTDESTFDDDFQGLLSFTINPDGSFSQNGPIVDTQGGRPEYIAAWPGSQKTVLGDVNLDGVVNLLDVPAFVDLLTSGQFQAEADINGDGLVNLLDVGGFVDLLTG